ncbi:MAG: Hsp70 family protein [Saprospiraceae bacterium]|nr:Hsp70 family protein [Saprospiraceae bacterium]
MKEVLIGIDLGTTNSLIGKYENGRVIIFKNPVGQKDTLASVVGFRKDRILIGDKAREYLLKDAVNVFGGFKRKMGTDEKFYVVNSDENITPIQLSSYVLKELLSFLPESGLNTAAVITIPASFDSIQSNATQKAAELAGLNHIFLLQEPIAAGIAFMNECGSIISKNGYWLVYDLGGGTFDSAILKVENGELKVLGHEGNNYLGGVDFDAKIVEKILLPKILERVKDPNFEAEFYKKFGIYEKLYITLIFLAEEVKKDLSVMAATDIEFEFQYENEFFNFNIEITKIDFESIIAPIIEETILLTKKLINHTGINNSDINQIILVGGSTLIPLVKVSLSKEFGIEINNTIDPITIVARGAAYYASSKTYEEENYSDVIKAETEENKEKVHDEEVLEISIVYNATSMDNEELLIIKQTENDEIVKKYRVVRMDGGYDSGYMKLLQKNVQLLPLLPGYTNKFELKFYDESLRIIDHLSKEIRISQGLYNVSGQPLPKDICIEVDDLDNEATKLEVVFKKNSILPQKKMLYRQISKKIVKGSEDSIIINFLEGDSNSRPISNLPIGKIEISGKDLETDLFAHSDIEISCYMSESRILEIEVFLSMSGQEFKSVFSLTTRNVSLSRLQYHAHDLEKDMLDQLNKFNSSGQIENAELVTTLLFDVKSIQGVLRKLAENSVSDVKYQLAEKLQQLSKDFDNIGGEARLNEVKQRYIDFKQMCENSVRDANFGKIELIDRLNKLASKEASVLKSRSTGFIESAIEEIQDFTNEVNMYSISFLQFWFTRFQNIGYPSFKNPNMAKNIMVEGEKALANNNSPALRLAVLSLINLLKISDGFEGEKFSNFKGTGIK